MTNSISLPKIKKANYLYTKGDQFMYFETIHEYLAAVLPEKVKVLGSLEAASHEIGKHLVSLGKYDEALQQFYNVIDLDDSYEESHYEIAKIYLKRNDFERAAEHLERVHSKEKDEEYNYLWALIAKARDDMNSFENAIEISYGNNAEFLPTLIERARYFEGKQDPNAVQKAMESYDYYIFRYLKQRSSDRFIFNPKDHDVLAYVKFLFDNGYYELAIELGEQLIERFDTPTTFHLNEKISNDLLIEFSELSVKITDMEDEESFQKAVAVARLKARKFTQKILASLYEFVAKSYWKLNDKEKTLLTIGHALKFPVYNEPLVKWRDEILAETAEQNVTPQLIYQLDDSLKELMEFKEEIIEIKSRKAVDDLIAMMQSDPENIGLQNEQYAKLKHFIDEKYGQQFDRKQAEQQVKEALNRCYAGLYEKLEAFDQNCSKRIQSIGLLNIFVPNIVDALLDAESYYILLKDKSTYSIGDKTVLVFNYFKALEVLLVKWIGEVATDVELLSYKNKRYEKFFKNESCLIGRSEGYYTKTTLGNYNFFLKFFPNYPQYNHLKEMDPLCNLSFNKRGEFFDKIEYFIDFRNPHTHKVAMTAEKATEVRKAFYDIIGELAPYIVKTIQQKEIVEA